MSAVSNCLFSELEIIYYYYYYVVHENALGGSSVFGFPPIEHDSKRDMPGFEPGPASRMSYLLTFSS